MEMNMKEVDKETFLCICFYQNILHLQTPNTKSTRWQTLCAPDMSATLLAIDQRFSPLFVSSELLHGKKSRRKQKGQSSARVVIFMIVPSIIIRTDIVCTSLCRWRRQASTNRTAFTGRKWDPTNPGIRPHLEPSPVPKMWTSFCWKLEKIVARQ